MQPKQKNILRALQNMLGAKDMKRIPKPQIEQGLKEAVSTIENQLS